MKYTHHVQGWLTDVVVVILEKMSDVTLILTKPEF